MKIAATRDRLPFIAGYYGLILLASSARHASMHRRGVHLTWDNFFLPLNGVFTCIPPFLFTYQLDLALPPMTVLGVPIGGKVNRLAEEAERIRSGTTHRWFDCKLFPEVDDSTCYINKPLCLPPTLEAAYKRERLRSTKALAEKALPPEAEWAVFQDGCHVKVE
ncbi:unnamed protein product [Polarella glacialis]|uniref:Uncharacterized protein n=2 Tax=Polarella glacialis TaxID=89957 RepID=A0A813HYF8_POLGL|nr:unnamed protein product [Polarella glacialis]